MVVVVTRKRKKKMKKKKERRGKDLVVMGQLNQVMADTPGAIAMATKRREARRTTWRGRDIVGIRKKEERKKRGRRGEERGRRMKKEHG